MNRYLANLTVTFLLIATGKAQATAISVTAEAPGILMPSVSSATVLTFDNLPLGQLPLYSFSGGTLSGSGAILNSTVLNAAQPFADTTQYLAVSYPDQAGSVELLLSKPENYFGLYWGSMDDWNSITFVDGGKPVASFSGTDVASLTGLVANGDQQSFSSNRYVEFELGNRDVYNEVVLTTSQYNFEVDNIAFADPPAPIPEPGILWCLGFALSGFVLMQRQRAAWQDAEKLPTSIKTAIPTAQR